MGLTKAYVYVVKDRQHRSRGGIGVSFVTHKVKGSEGRAIHQSKGRLISYRILSNNISFINCKNWEIKTDFFILFFCANTNRLLYFQHCNFAGMYLTSLSREVCLKSLIQVLVSFL